jgi:hypothetical protein
MRNFVVLIVTVLACSELTLAGGEYVPMTVAPDGIIEVPILVNGQGPFPFVIDTGSSRTVVGADLARALELPIVAKTEVISVSGREFRPVARLTASVGTSPSSSLLASVVPVERLLAAGRGVRGIIGQDLLMTLNYTLDYKRQRFTPSLPADRDRSSIELPLEVHEGRVLLALPAGAGQPPIRLVPDSGSTMFVVFGREGKAPFALEYLRGAMQVGTLASTQNVPMVRLREVRLGRLALRDQMAALVERSSRTGSDSDGLLPLQIFARVVFDMQRRVMIATPRS